MRADRLMSALLLLQARGQMTGRELAEKLEVSERTVHRDMEALSASGVPVYAMRGSHGGWQLDEDWRTQVPGLDEAELRALLMAQPRSLGDKQLAAAADRAIGKLMASLPQSLRERASSIRDRLYIDTTGWLGTSENLSMLAIVQEAVARDRKLSFLYWRAGREKVERTVDPLGLIAKGSTWYLFAGTDRGYRTYRISRMEDAKLLDAPSVRPRDFNLEAAWRISAEEFRDEVNREIEASRLAYAARLEAERRALQEMEIAKQVQARLFPQRLPPLQSLDYAGVCIQARQVGGDYYDFLHLGENRLGLVIGDIAGKGIAGALLMANLQANLRGQLAIVLDHPHHLLHSVNQLFYENTGDSSYATLFYAEYEDHIQRLHYANCGHLPALLLRSGGDVDWLHSTCTVVGMFADWQCETKETCLNPGDTVVLFTDGVTEACNQRGEEFGLERLADSLQRNRHLPSQDLLKSIADELQLHSPEEQADDITLIVAKCRETEQKQLFPQPV
ncbi:SpoIIE family protein phosphatase [Acidobacterium sp. S8]|uniref:SpoIIE family protein phosphatase n=1 Tax=Acidobacterium sp. S8 TaxID=1641854 RepID=UPI00131DEEC2|nr:SpoIIE family protein phosphatase [Acidobacterium sp. S8]